MYDVSLLLNLQALDKSIAYLKEDLSDTEISINDDSSVLKAQDIYSQISTVHDKVKKDQRETEREIQKLEDRKDVLETKAYSGGISNPKELSTLQSEVDNLISLIKAQEEILLSRMEETEKYEQGLSKALSQLENVQNNHAQKIITLQSRQTELLSQLNSEEPKQKAVREQCSSKILQIYDRVSKANKGIAVALAESDRCSECQLSIPTKILESLKTSDDLIYCNSCGRILLRDSRK